ncbi:putative patched family protein [Botrytis fragariae]|uniref:Putative patched family protein n=1 Tax=Botrytis fragariae TaxID=1964551 RepID=A0A8H6AT47_9HELO|nr:putative patched family protein [Botrytis fragariae]KAF5872950.1 putative patched family protein [Botrytis fragariae]
MTAVPPPGDTYLIGLIQDDRWAPGFELPIPSAEGEDKKDEGTSESKDNDKAVPTKKAETIRGTATVNQPGPNLAERPEQETTAEYFASWAEAERMMRADLEKGKFTAEQVDEVKKLMEAGAIKMKLPYKRAPGEMTLAQWEEKAAKLEAELKNKGQEGDKYVAQLMALQDQLRRSEVANLEMETRNAKLEKERNEAMAKIDKAAQEKRDKKNQEDKEKEDKKRKAEAEKHVKALYDRDNKIRALEQKLDALSKRAEAEKKEREKAAARDTYKDKRAEILQKQALEKDEKIKKLENDLEAEKHKNDLEEAGYHGGDELQAIIKRLEHEKRQLKKEAAKLEDVIQGLNEKVRGLESSQVRFLDAAIREENAGKERDNLEINVVALKQRIEQYEDEEKRQIEREHVLRLDRQTLGAQVVQKQTEINQLNEKVNQSKEKITALEGTIETLSKAVNDSSGTLGREFVILEAEIKTLERRVKERDAKISQQESEIGAQKKTIEEQALKIRIGTPGASHGEVAMQNQAILKENMELKRQLEDMQKNLGAENSEELKRQLEASQRKLEASQKEYAVVQERVEKLLQELEEVRKTKFGDGANASEIERLKQELEKATKDIQNFTQNSRRAVNEINRLKKENTGSVTMIQTITGKLSRATNEINRLDEKKKEDAETIRHLNQENGALQFEISRLRSLRPQAQVHPSQKELESKRIKIGHYQDQGHEWRIREDELKAQVDDYEKQIEELTAITQQSDALISDMTAEQKELHETLDKLKLELAAKSIDDTGGGGETPADAAERERVHAEKIKELTDRNSALSKQVDALKEEIEKIRKNLTETNTDAEKEKTQLNQQQAHASAQTIHMLMGFMILQRALNGKVSGDMDRVLAAVDQARLQAEAIGDEKLIVEVSYLAAIAVYYDGDTPKALASFNAVKDSKDWDDSKKDLVKQWIAHCEKGTDCPKGRGGYREALGLGPVPPSFRAPPKLPKDNDDEEAKKAKKKAKKAKKQAKKAKKAEKRAAKKSKAGTKPRRASAPKRRGIHRPDLYVGILSPRQQQIWDTIDFSDFDYNHLTPEQQSLFSFFPIDSEPESPRRPVVHRAAGPSSELSPLPAPRAHFGLPPLPLSDPDSDAEAPPPPPPPAPQKPPGKIKPQRSASSGASSAASVQAAKGVQEGQPSRMSRPTTDAALHIQYLVAQLAESGRRIRELEPAGAIVESLTGRVERRDKQIETLKIFCEQVVAENITLKGDAQ